jgi:hypothetical protein
MAPPVGRPLIEHVWTEGLGWVHVATGEPFSPDVYLAGVRRRQRELERRRYWDPSTGTRERRWLRTKRQAAAKPRKTSKVQLTLDQARSDTPGIYGSLREIDNDNE